jgi:hypothetical protein
MSINKKDLSFISTVALSKYKGYSEGLKLPDESKDLTHQEKIALSYYLAVVDFFHKYDVKIADNRFSVELIQPDSSPSHEDYE